MHLLVIGSSRDQKGGVETFCERAKEALEATGRYEITWVRTNTAYMNLRRLPAMLDSVGRVIACRRPDCVWLQYSSILDLVYLALCKAMGRKVLVTPHLGSNWRSQLNPVLKSISGTLLKLADRLALLSRTQQEEIALPANVPRGFIRTFLPGLIWAQPLAALTGGEPDALRIVHAGRLSEGKGSHLVIEVCAQLKARGVPFTASIAGGASEEFMGQLKGLIAQHGLQDRVVLTGVLANADLLKLLMASDVLVHLSKIDSYPLIVLESMAYGMFPVCLDLAGARDMVTSFTGKVVGAADPAGETAAFLASQSPAGLRAAGRQAAQQVRDHYRWDACAAALEQAIGATVTPH
jgi:glycosyltransferase involved in cell wall biosynthesis